MAVSMFSFRVSGLRVTFTNARPGLSHFWDFGDGTFSYGENAVHDYAVAGSYSVSLTVIDSAGPATSQQTVVVTSGDVETTEVFEFDALSFPVAFTVVGTPFSTGPLLYRGTWESYPVLELVGPFDSVVVINYGTGVSLSFVGTVAAGSKRVVSWQSDGTYSVVDEDGLDRDWELSPESNLAEFNLRPAHLLTRPQVIEGLFNGVSSATRLILRYYERFF